MWCAKSELKSDSRKCVSKNLSRFASVIHISVMHEHLVRALLPDSDVYFNITPGTEGLGEGVGAKPDRQSLDDLVQCTRRLVEECFPGDTWFVSAMAQRTSVKTKIDGAVGCVAKVAAFFSVFPDAKPLSRVRIGMKSTYCQQCIYPPSTHRVGQNIGENWRRVSYSPTASWKHV
jgi:hypothetical protein